MVQVSPTHGLNPSLQVCYTCGESIGVLLMGRMRGDAEAPRNSAIPGHLCDRCNGIISEGGCILLEAEEDSTEENPTRTGRMWGMAAQWKDRMEVDSPIAFITRELVEKMQLPEPGDC